MTLPSHAASPAEISADLAALRAGDSPTNGGHVLAYVYDSGLAQLPSIAADALVAFAEVNALDPTVFPSVAVVENDLVGWGLGLLHASESAVGSLTSGGTESCLLAVKTARNRWRASRPHTTERPVVLMPVTGHSAFAKGCSYFDVELRTLPVDPQTFTVAPQTVADALAEAGERVCLVVVSAPSYAHGVLDPVAACAELTTAAEVPLHVDACIGGWVLPFCEINGEQLPLWDFRVPGVSSISVDLHKYAYAPKGSSLLLFSDAEYRLHSYFAYSDWPGYPVVNTTMQSTKSGAPMAAAWAVVRAIGAEGYARLVADARQATAAIVDEVTAISGLRVVGSPVSTLVALGADPEAEQPIDPFVLADRMKARGWFIQPQPSVHGMPRTAHLTVQAVTWPLIDEFCTALREAAAEARSAPAAAAPADLLAAAQALDPGTLSLTDVATLLTFAGLDTSGGPQLPAESANIQALLEALPTSLRDTLLKGYFSAIFTPTRG